MLRREGHGRVFRALGMWEKWLFYVEVFIIALIERLFGVIGKS